MQRCSEVKVDEERASLAVAMQAFSANWNRPFSVLKLRVVRNIYRVSCGLAISSLCAMLDA